MTRCLTVLSSLFCLPLAGCLVPKDSQPQVDIGLAIDSKAVHRGMTLVDKEVLRPNLGVTFDSVTGGNFGVATEGIVELHNDPGDAWFPAGHAGRFTQIEMIADYEHRFGWLGLRGGIHSYNLPNGTEFAIGERGGTNELFLLTSVDVLGMTVYGSLHHDFDEVKDHYLRGGAAEEFDLGGGFTATLDGSIGYAGADQSAWMYGIETSGYADLRGRAELGWQFDDRTRITASANASYMVDQALQSWFDDLGIDREVLWFSLGVGWTF